MARSLKEELQERTIATLVERVEEILVALDETSQQGETLKKISSDLESLQATFHQFMETTVASVSRLSKENAHLRDKLIRLKSRWEALVEGRHQGTMESKPSANVNINSANDVAVDGSEIHKRPDDE